MHANTIIHWKTAANSANNNTSSGKIRLSTKQWTHRNYWHLTMHCYAEMVHAVCSTRRCLSTNGWLSPRAENTIPWISRDSLATTSHECYSLALALWRHEGLLWSNILMSALSRKSSFSNITNHHQVISSVQQEHSLSRPTLATVFRDLPKHSLHLRCSLLHVYNAHNTFHLRQHRDGHQQVSDHRQLIEALQWSCVSDLVTSTYRPRW